MNRAHTIEVVSEALSLLVDKSGVAFDDLPEPIQSSLAEGLLAIAVVHASGGMDDLRRLFDNVKQDTLDKAGFKINARQN